VLEIGPGRGALTAGLAAAAAHLYLIEIDPRLAADWRRRYGGDPRVTVWEGDAMTFDLGGRLQEPVKVVANLPYESATAMVGRLLGLGTLVTEMVVMLQKEVALRLAASAGAKGYGRLTVLTRLKADIEEGMTVGPDAFRPRPKVHSMLLRIRPLPRPRYEVGDEQLFADLLEAAFSSRRKMLRNSLSPWLDRCLGRRQGLACIEEAGIDASDRPERIGLEAWARLSAGVCLALERNAGTAGN
jgi:16S rRNA (adenine1518-N6/adenine1519-N6)-dimethyltransferase